MMEGCGGDLRFLHRHTATDGIPYWDTGARDCAISTISTGVRRSRRTTSSRSTARPPRSCPGCCAMGRGGGDRARWWRDYIQAGLTVLETLLSERYLSSDPDHQGLVLHSQYHRPNGWDYVPPGRTNPCGEATMWGDYHMRELALYVQRLAENGPYLTFFAS